MNTFLLFAIPSVLVIIGMIFNNFKLAYAQPESSSEQDPVKRLAAERQAHRAFFDLQRTRSLKRQKRVGQYAWLVLVALIGSFWWMYLDTVNTTTAVNQIAAIQTLGATEGKELILSVTLRDGNNVKYVIKSEKAGTADGGAKEGLSKEPVSAWEISNLRTALSSGDSVMPLGIALKISN